MRRTVLLAAAAAVLAALLLGGTAAAAPAKVVGKVGPGYTIGLFVGGKKVKTLRAGKAYRFVVSDRSEDHDFHLIGPGVSRTITSEEFTGTRSVVLKLRKGTYRFLCAPHADDMRGSFKAVG
jgi:plastocyanin